MKRGIHSFHPIVCFLYYVGTGALVMLYKHPVFLLLGAILLVAFCYVLDQGKILRNSLVPLIIVSLFFLVLNPLINHRGNHILFYIGHNQIMLEAIIQGAILALTLFSLMVLFATYNLVITPEKFLFLFSKWFPQWALLTMLSMRFMPLLKRRLREIETVQKGKGLSISEGSLKQRAKNGILLVQILLTWSLEEALQTADSMTARGYGIRKRSRYTPYKMKPKDWIAIGYMMIIGSIGIFGWWLGDGVLAITPILESMYLEGREWFYLLIFTLFIGFPLGIEAREGLLWHYWQQNT